MNAGPVPFGIAQTHGLLTRDGLRVDACSEGSGWSSLFASAQRERPFERRCDAVPDPLVVLHIDGPVGIERSVGKRTEHCVIPPGAMHIIPDRLDFTVRLLGSLRTLHLYVRRSVLDEVAADCVTGDPTRITLVPRLGETDPLLERLLLALRDVLRDDHPATACYADHLAHAVAARLIRRHSNVCAQPPHSEVRAVSPCGDVDRAIAFMRQNLRRSIDLADIAAVTPFTASHFARRFRQAIGVPPHRYLLGLRIEHAARLLRDTRQPIVDIADECGFANQEHLTRMFKRAAGITPKAYRTVRST